MNTNTGARWQPYGDQFKFACRVCFYRDSSRKECHNCKCEKEPGFVFDPDKFIELCREMNRERYFYDSKSGKLIRLDKNELDNIKADRDYWRSMADKALQQIVHIADRSVCCKCKKGE